MDVSNNKVRFSPLDKSDFINELRGKVNAYFDTNNISKYGNINLLVKAVFMFTLYIGPYLFMLLGIITSPLGELACWIMMGMGMAGVGMALMHDANHSVFSKNKSVNSLLSHSLFLLGGFPPTWQYQHNTLHHGFTNVDGLDDDIAPVGVLRFSPHKPLHKYHKYQYLYAWFFYGLMSLSWSTIKDFQQFYKYKKMGANFSPRQLFVNLILSKILYYVLFLVIPILVFPVAWYWIVLSYLAMHFTCGVILSAIFQTAHVVPSSIYPLPNENGNINNNWAVHQLQTTADYSPRSRVFSWLIGGLNYQVEHHLFPNISHVHYRKIAHMVETTALKYGLPYHVNDNFLLAVRSHVKMLRLLGR